MKEIAIVTFGQESNSFTPVKSTCEDYKIETGEKAAPYLDTSAIFQMAGYHVVPIIFAYAVPGGILEEASYKEIRGKIIELLSGHEKLSGILLNLHGALEVENIGSGEADLVAQIRNLFGAEMPIAVSLDLHANNTERLIQQVNIVCGYKTAPHVDEYETRQKAARLLLDAMENHKRPQSVLVRVPMIVPGDMATTDEEPMKSIMNRVRLAETKKGILCASYFCGMAWVDAENSSSTVVVTTEGDLDAAYLEAREIADLAWTHRSDFHFEEEALELEKAIDKAAKLDGMPVFITDSGDNVTGGAPGDSARCLRALLDKQIHNALVAGITDKTAVDHCENLDVGCPVELNIGGSLNPDVASMKVTGTLKWKGNICNQDDLLSAAIVITVNDTDIDVIITDRRCQFVSPEIIESANVEIKDYKIVVVKQGYLYDQLRKVSQHSILALTEGPTDQKIKRFHYNKVIRPIFPLDSTM